MRILDCSARTIKPHWRQSGVVLLRLLVLISIGCFPPVAFANATSDYPLEREVILSKESIPEESLPLTELLPQSHKNVTGKAFSADVQHAADERTGEKDSVVSINTNKSDSNVNSGVQRMAISDNTAVPVKQLPLNQPVIDRANLLTADKKQALTTTLRDWYTKNYAQAAIVIVPTTGNESLFAYGMQIVEDWQLGSKKRDDGLLILVAVNDRKMHIFTGYGLEEILPDVVLKRIIRQQITPQFKRGDYFSGLQAGLSVIQARLTADPEELKNKDEAQAQNDRARVQNDDWDGFPLLFVGIFALALSSALKTYFGRLLGSALTAGGFFAVLATVGLPLHVIVFSSAVVFVIAVIGFVSGGGGGSSGGTGTSFGGGGFSSGGSSGGYSGGGGSFGGGGAGGSW